MLAFSSDVDWAPEEVIQFTIDLFNRYGIKCTFFATHKSDVLLKNEGERFEIGLHPNFNNLLNGSAGHGTALSIVKDLQEIYPMARGIRSHSVTQSSVLLDIFVSQGFTYDSNIFLPYQTNIKPFRLWNDLIRVPYNWEDDVHWEYGRTFEAQPFFPSILENHYWIFDFHPIHVFLNTDQRQTYLEAKQYYHFADQLRPFINTRRPGTRDFLIQLLEFVSSNHLKNLTLGEVSTQNL